MVKWKQADTSMAEYGRSVLETIRSNGYEAYWVGGCVRDELMGRPIHDMDMTTSARPEFILRMFPRTVPTGMQHGTVTVLEGNYAFEVTTFRTESGYKDHRRPDTVTYVDDITEDLRRRDFTMNAIALGADGLYIDPFEGQKDITTRMVRCVGEASTRFEEDALRMLRCIRFASVFDFRITYRTWRGLLDSREGFQHIAVERIRTELEKIVAGPYPLRGLELLHRSQLLSYAKVPVSCDGYDKHLLERLDDLEREDLTLRWFLILLAGNWEASAADQLLRQYTFPNSMRERIVAQLNIHEEAKILLELLAQKSREQAGKEAWVDIVLKYGTKASTLWLQFMQAAGGVINTAAMPWLESLHQWMNEMPVQELKQLCVTGNEVIEAAGMKGGPWLKDLLQHLLRLAALDQISNAKEDLIEEVRRVLHDRSE